MSSINLTFYVAMVTKRAVKTGQKFESGHFRTQAYEREIYIKHRQIPKRYFNN